MDQQDKDMQGEDLASEIKAAGRRGFSRRGFVKGAGLGALTFVGAALAGCANNPDASAGSASGSADAGSSDGEKDTFEVTDMGGTKVQVPTKLEKYADGWFAHNEVTIMLTGAKGLVATACDPKAYGWMYKVNEPINDATLSFGQGFNFEELAALKPQVIFDSKDTLRDKAAEVGIPVVNCLFTTFDEMQKSIELSATVFGGDAPDIAQKYNKELDKTVKGIEAKTKGLAESEKPKVMHGASVYALTIDGTQTIIDDWIKVAGGVNAVTESTKGNAQAKFSMEQVLAWNPDVIITGKAGEDQQILNDPNWASVKAVQDKKVYVNPKGVFGWDRYGVEELLQVQWAASILHPDLFKDLKIEDKVKDFYKTYLNYELTDEDVKLIMAAKQPAK